MGATEWQIRDGGADLLLLILLEKLGGAAEFDEEDVRRNFSRLRAERDGIKNAPVPASDVAAVRRKERARADGTEPYEDVYEIRMRGAD